MFLHDVNYDHFNIAYGEKSTASSLLALMYLVEHIEAGNEYSKEIQRFLNIDEEYATGIATALHWE